MENTYPHNGMMHRNTTLKFGMPFDLAKYFEHTQKFQHMEYGRGLVNPTLNFGTPYLSQKLTELESCNLARW